MQAHDDHQAHALVGCALGHIAVGSGADLRQAGLAVSRAYQLFVKSGMTPQQAVERIVALAEVFGSLE